MAKTNIFFFSGTGNTWWIAEALQKKLSELGRQAGVYSIEQMTAEEAGERVREADHIILGFPAYGSAPPFPMREFMENLPEASEGQRASLFATQALASGDTALHAGRALEKKGYLLTRTGHFNMMNNFHIPKYRFYKPENGRRRDRKLQKAMPTVEKMARDIQGNRVRLPGKSAMARWLGNLQRKHIDRIIANLSKDFAVDREKCIDCGKCVRICPTGNIESREGILRFNENCTLCLRCYSQCPVSAVLIGRGSENTKKYPRYAGPVDHMDVRKLTGND